MAQDIAEVQAKSAGARVELASGHAFRVRSAHDIFRKLYRERERFEKAGAEGTDVADQVDAAINFAVTAWHITDWVWQYQKDKLRESYGVGELAEFQSEIRKQCPELAVCDVIANAAKHGGTAHPKKDRPNLETVLVADSVELVADAADRRWSLRIEIDGKNDDIHAVFYRVFQFWHKFIQKYCV